VSEPLITDPSNLQSKLKLTAACPQVTVKVDNTDVQCLLDTGSQVTLFSENLCNEEVLSWLKLRTANGLSIPYVGYIVTDF